MSILSGNMLCKAAYNDNYKSYSQLHNYVSFVLQDDFGNCPEAGNIIL